MPDGEELPCRFLEISGNAGGKVRSADNVAAVSGMAGGKTDVAGTLASISGIAGVKTNIAGTLAGNSGMAGGRQGLPMYVFPNTCCVRPKERTTCSVMYACM